MSGPAKILVLDDSTPAFAGASASASAAAAAIGRACAAAVTAMPAADIPVAELARRAKEFDLTVLGVRAPEARGAGRLSLRTWQLVRGLPTPVLLVPEGSPARFERVLLCTGGETYIADGVEFAAGLAAALGAAITVLHVLPAAPDFYRDLPLPIAPRTDFLAGESRLARQLRSQLASIEKQGAAATLEVAQGSVERGIFEVAGRVGADLIVVGSSPARGPLGASILGNVTREVAARSGVPVLIVRSRPPGLLRDLWKILREG